MHFFVSIKNWVRKKCAFLPAIPAPDEIYPPDATKPPDDDGNIIASDWHKKQLRVRIG